MDGVISGKVTLKLCSKYNKESVVITDGFFVLFFFLGRARTSHIEKGKKKKRSNDQIKLGGHFPTI